jgi:hypothetical protein
MNRRRFLSFASLALATALPGLASASAPPPGDELQWSLDRAADRGEPLRLPPGTVVVHRTLRLRPGHPGLRGAGPAATVLQAAPELVGPVLQAEGGPASVADLGVQRGHQRVFFGARGVGAVRVG